MNCINHKSTPANGICVNCGIALCDACYQKTPSGRLVCSAECASAASILEKLFNALSEKTQISVKITAWMCWGIGVIFILSSLIYALNKDLFMATFLGLSSMIFIITGILFNKTSAKK